MPPHPHPKQSRNNMENIDIMRVINKFLRVDGENIKAEEVVGSTSHETLIALVSFLIGLSKNFPKNK